MDNISSVSELYVWKVRCYSEKVWVDILNFAISGSDAEVAVS